MKNKHNRAPAVTRRCRLRALRPLGWICLVATLAGCAASTAFREGNNLLAAGKTRQGLLKLEQAAALEPSNPEYRIAYLSRRNGTLKRMLSVADATRRDGRGDESEAAYRQVLDIDPENAMARQGLAALAIERRNEQRMAQAEARFQIGGPAAFDEVLELLRPILLEQPEQKAALALKGRIEEARLKARPELRLGDEFQKPISLEFRDAPLRSVFDAIAQASGLNFFFDSEVRPDLKITVLAKNTSIEDAIHLLVTTNQLRQKVLNGNSVLIYPNLPGKIKDYQPMVVRTFFLANADAKAVAAAIKTIVKTQDIVVDERLGTLLLRDTPEAIRMAERIVALQDMNDPEVMLEVEVMEVKRSRLMELGVQWPSQLALAPLQAGSSKLTLQDLKSLNAGALQATLGTALINVRKEDQDTSMLANPRIRVRNREKAKIMIGDRVPVITTTSTTIAVAESVNYVDVGLKLEVEPTIYLDDEVAIKVGLEVSSVVREILSKSGTLSYQIGSRAANTVLRLKNGETQILAGLISDEDRSSANKVPGVGELPLLGRLFGSQKDDGQRNEILLSITPRVLRSLRRPDLMSAEFESGTEANMGAKPLTLSSFASAANAAPAAAMTPAPAAPATAVPAQPLMPLASPASDIPGQGLPSGVPKAFPSVPAGVPPLPALAPAGRAGTEIVPAGSTK